MRLFVKVEQAGTEVGSGLSAGAKCCRFEEVDWCEGILMGLFDGEVRETG